MKSKILILSVIVPCLVCCATIEYSTKRDKPEIEKYYYLDYDVSLVEVERPAKAKERYGEQTIISTEENNYSYAFEDDMMKILWNVHPRGLSFFMTNKTEYSIRIIWDEAAYVDEKNVSQKIMHSGIKYIDKDKSQSPSAIVRRGAFSDEIIPTEKIHYAGQAGWIVEPLLPYWGDSLITRDFSVYDPLDLGVHLVATIITFRSQEVVVMRGNKVVDKTIQVLLPIQIEGVINDYIFIFKVNGYEEKIFLVEKK